MIVEAGKPEIGKVGHRRRPKEELMLFMSEGSLLVEFPFPQKRSIFFLLRPSMDWMKSTHIMEVNLLYPKSTDLKVNLI